MSKSKSATLKESFEATKPKQVIVPFTAEQHAGMEAFQEAARLDGSKKMSKSDIAIMVFEELGLDYLAKATERLKEAHKAIL